MAIFYSDVKPLSKFSPVTLDLPPATWLNSWWKPCIWKVVWCTCNSGIWCSGKQVFCFFFSFSSTQVWSPSSVHYLLVCKLSYLVCSFQPANRSRYSYAIFIKRRWGGPWGEMNALRTKTNPTGRLRGGYGQVKMAGYCPIFVWPIKMKSRSIKMRKKRTRPTCSHLDQTSFRLVRDSNPWPLRDCDTGTALYQRLLIHIFNDSELM